MNYKIKADFQISCGFKILSKDISESVDLTNHIISDLPASLYKSIDFKTTSAVIGAIFCESLASKLDAIVNPIEKGHPDIVPTQAQGAAESELRNYPHGLEIKTTIGNIKTGANLRAGEQRISVLSGLTWQAHHQEVRDLLGLTWDFMNPKSGFNFPAISGVFYGHGLVPEDWGAISGTTGRNTKVSGMKKSAIIYLRKQRIGIMYDGTGRCFF